MNNVRKGLVVASTFFAHGRDTPPNEVGKVVRCREGGLSILIGYNVYAHNIVWARTSSIFFWKKT